MVASLTLIDIFADEGQAAIVVFGGEVTFGCQTNVRK
ncbi:hypothetical protein BD293_3115 [Roseinatronobacter monicus]|uniref:Uncharacterized protein n=1 Tax=Roseinatronobacter monicus TaxID=393481 RepID=A0A543KHE1_9RHOB|nr:hypothetical protein BD293_3115 [Roseinatronobacter monicus]